MISETSPKDGKDQNIHFRVTEEPEDMLEHYWITATGSTEKSW